jgi:TonB family protein
MARKVLAMRFTAVAILVGATLAAFAQQPAPTQHDPSIDIASEYIGQALFLRCFCAENNLSFDEQGKPTEPIKAEDWTLAAVNVTKVERKGPGEVELEGVRAAIRFTPDRREFDRHALNDEKMRIMIADRGDPKQMKRALEAIFAVGIDLPLQRSMPDHWRHYFDSQVAWPGDALSGQTIYGGNSTGMTPPNVTHKAEPSYTTIAERDRVVGTVLLRFVVDAEGVPRHVSIAQPLGYGLDERAVEAIAKLRFAPAMSGGKPVAAMVSIRQDFALMPMPR